MWRMEETPLYLRRKKTYAKKHKRELEAVLDNTDTFFDALCMGVIPRDVKYWFVHPEPHGVLAIDQKGGGRNLAETRLYVYPDAGERTPYLLSLGDKRTQRADIEDCSELVRELLKKGRPSRDPQNESSDEPETDLHKRPGDGSCDV